MENGRESELQFLAARFRSNIYVVVLEGGSSEL